MGRNLVLALLCCAFAASTLVAQSLPAPGPLAFPRAALAELESRRLPPGPPVDWRSRGWEAPPRDALGMPQLQFVLSPQQEAAEGDGYERWARRLALVQGTYYTATGLWPIFHMPSFEAVTGPKTDDWLVQTVGALLAVVGGTLLVTGLRDAPSRDLAMVAVGSAAALTAVDVIFVAQGRISPIYLLDAVVETALIAGWAVALRQ